MERTNFRHILLTALFMLVTIAVTAQTPRRASGIDSLGTGGDLGGNTNPPSTLVPVPKDDGLSCTYTQRFTLCGRALTTSPRGQIIVLRRRTPDGYLTEKKVMK